MTTKMINNLVFAWDYINIIHFIPIFQTVNMRYIFDGMRKTDKFSLVNISVSIFLL